MDEMSDYSLPFGRCAEPEAQAPEPWIWCWVCGRPLAADEDFGQWRLRTVRRSCRYLFEFRPVCPAHYRPFPSRRPVIIEGDAAQTCQIS